MLRIGNSIADPLLSDFWQSQASHTFGKGSKEKSGIFGDAEPNVKITDAYPVVGDLVFYVLVFDFEPFSFVDGFEDVAVGVGHGVCSFF